MLQDIFAYERRGKSDTGEVLGELVPTGIRPKFAESLAAAGVAFDPAVLRGE